MIFCDMATIRRIFKKVFVYPFQRMFRGYDDTDLWNLDVSISKRIVRMLKDFKKVTQGYPACLDSFEEWMEILDKMIYCFDFHENHFDELYELSEEEYKKKLKLADEGFDLFKKYYQDLWW